jgi:hypothetical protein
MKMQIYLFIVILFYSLSASTQLIQPRQAPDTWDGEGKKFTDDYTVILEDRESFENFLEMSLKHSFGKVKRSPWSDSYWPTYMGSISTRYLSPERPSEKDSWDAHYDFYNFNPPETLIEQKRIFELSPAEKYDLLVEDQEWSVTEYLWDKGRRKFEQSGFVPTWWGLCHGWAAASQLGLPVPKKNVLLVDRHDNVIEFTRFDIQALVSYMWARPYGENLFTGRRCYTDSPKKDGKKVIDPPCFDVNPKTWHLSLVNRVGRYNQSLIMDTSHGAEVWNYVVDHYSIKYFNPQTREFSPQLSESVVSLADYPADPFEGHRAEATTHIVGVMMDVFHPAAIVPHNEGYKEPKLDAKRYVYDLELDAQGNVVGGEWYGDHPDFLWLFPEKYNPFIENYAGPHNQLAELEVRLSEKEIKDAESYSKKGLVSPSIIYKILHKSL